MRIVLNSLFILFFSLQSAAALALPHRVVTLTPVLAEWMDEILGKEETLKRLAGVSGYTRFPAYLENLPTVGAYHQLDAEKISSLKPDLVIASAEATPSVQLDQLKRLHVPLFIAGREDFNHMPEWILKLANALGAPEKGAKAVARWNHQVQELKTLAMKKSGSANLVVKRMMIEVQDSPLIVVGGTSFLNEAFATIGYQNVFRSLNQSYPKISKEAVLQENPDEIFILDLGSTAMSAESTPHPVITTAKAIIQTVQNGGESPKKSGYKKGEEAATPTGSPVLEPDLVLNWKKLTGLKAVKNDAIRMIPADDFARCSPQLLKALKQLR